MKKTSVQSNINLETLAGGAFAEKLNEALMQVAENIQNPNTEATTKRQIQINTQICTEQNETARKHPDRCHDQARSNRSDRHSNDYGRKYENRPDRDRRI